MPINKSLWRFFHRYANSEKNGKRVSSKIEEEEVEPEVGDKIYIISLFFGLISGPIVGTKTCMIEKLSSLFFFIVAVEEAVVVVEISTFFSGYDDTMMMMTPSSSSSS